MAGAAPQFSPSIGMGRLAELVAVACCQRMGPICRPGNVASPPGLARKRGVLTQSCPRTVLRTSLQAATLLDTLLIAANSRRTSADRYRRLGCRPCPSGCVGGAKYSSDVLRAAAVQAGADGSGAVFLDEGDSFAGQHRSQTGAGSAVGVPC